MAFIPPQASQFSSPRMPYHAAFSFQPQSTWGGLDYYRAHALNPEPSLYEDAWGGVRDRSSIGVDIGVVDEARHLHRLAYDMPGEINRMSPVEIGHAAAYEAYDKTWLRNNGMYEMVGERERQREGLVGIAVAEVTRLLQFSRHADRYSQSVAADAAAHTATMLVYQGQDDYPRSRSRSRMRAGSYAGSHMSMLDPMTDDIWPERSRSMSRSRSHHRHYSSSPPRHRSRSRMYGDYPAMGGVSYSSSYGGYPSSPSGYNVPYSTGNPWSGAPISPSMMSSGMSSGMYPSSYPVQPMYASQPIGSPYQTSLYNAGGVVPSTMGYPAMSYAGSSLGGVPAQPTVVVLEGSKRKHRHRR